MKHTLQTIGMLLLLSLTACRGRAPQAAMLEEGDSIAFKYSRLLHITRYKGFHLVTVDNPWKPGMTLHRYLLVERQSSDGQQGTLSAEQQGTLSAEQQGTSSGGPEETTNGESLAAALGATLVRVPLQRSVVFTSLHAALLSELGAESQLKGVADLKYMKVPWIRQGVANGTLVDCGDGMAPLIEKIIDSQADAILLSPFENSGGYGRLEDIDIPLIECAEYMEPSPLARAEWLRFYGMLYGRQHEADSLFALVDSSYHALKQLAQTSSVRRSVIVDKQTGSVWYVPGGRSTIGQMLKDAECDYPFASDTHSGSLSLPFETVFERGGSSEVWLFRYDSEKPITRSKLLSEQNGYSQLTAVKTGELYGCNVMTSMFYEESPFRPDLLLQDFIQILHPDIRNLPPLRYYYKVED